MKRRTVLPATQGEFPGCSAVGSAAAETGHWREGRAFEDRPGSFTRQRGFDSETCVSMGSNLAWRSSWMAARSEEDRPATRAASRTNRANTAAGIGSPGFSVNQRARLVWPAPSSSPSGSASRTPCGKPRWMWIASGMIQAQ
jgi:hypothetical protein